MIISNSKISLNFSQNGLKEITDLTNKNSYKIKKTGYEIKTEDKTFFGPMNFERKDENSVTFKEKCEDTIITTVYTLCGDLPFFEREISISREGNFNVIGATCENIEFENEFDEVLLHDDKSLWHCPENYFLKTENGGMVMGLCYPYWETKSTNNSVSIGYTMNFLAKDELVLEKTFYGVYQNEGIKRYTHGPYLGKKEMPYFPGFLKGSGLYQHFKDFIIPDDAEIEPEELDWGAVWAMQDYFKYRLPRLPLPEQGYFLWQNGWWAGLSKPDMSAIEVLLDSGVHDIMTQQIAFGHDKHPNTEPKYVKDVNIDPLMFPVYEGEDNVDFKAPTALHADVKKEKDKKIIGYTEDFRAPAIFENFFKEANKKGMHIGSFSMPNVAYKNGKEWYSVDKDGNAKEYFKTKLSCPGCDEFMDFHFDVVCKMIDSQDKRYWAFDGRWQDFKEIAGYHFNKIEDDRCQSDKHGHLPGDNRYKEFKNIQKFKEKLRKRYPNMCFEQYYGLKRGSVWMLDNLNADENYYETTGPDDNRFQNWHNENSRFRPHYMNFTNLGGDNYNDFCYSVISALSSSAYAQIAKGFYALRDDIKCREFLKKWRAWASENIDYLINRRCIFDCFGFTPLDGSAHIIKDKGYIFIFNTSDKKAIGKIKANHWIGLDKDETANYKVSSIYPDEKDILSVKYGDDFMLEILPKTANIFKICKSDENIKDTREFDKDAVIIEAFK